MPNRKHDLFELADPSTNLIVNYMPHNMKERELRAMFNIFGPIARVKVVREMATHESLCFGFVRFEVAQISLNGRWLRGKRLKVSIARPWSCEIKDANVFVAHLPMPYRTEQKLRSLFACFGNIIQLKIPNEEQQCFAFIRFGSRSSAELSWPYRRCMALSWSIIQYR